MRRMYSLRMYSSRERRNAVLVEGDDLAIEHHAAIP
jgi:hypothetical protein